MKSLLSWLAGPLLVLAFYLLAWPSRAELVAAVDFNDAWFEDWFGAYAHQGRSIGTDPHPVQGFYYSPTFALALAGLVRLGSGAWFALLVLASLLVVLLPLALVRVGPLLRGTYLTLACASFPLLHNMHWGQASVLLVALVLLALLAFERGHGGLFGLCLALAVSIKFWPLVFLIWVLLREDWHALFGSLAALVIVLFAVPALGLGVGETLDFYREVARSVRVAETTPGLWADAGQRQYLPAHLLRLVPELGLTSARVLGGVLFAGLCLGLRRTARLRSRRAQRADVRVFALLFLAMPLIVPPAWPHWFVFLPFAWLVVADSATRTAGAARVGLGLAALVAALASSVFAFRWVADPAAFGRHGYLAAADLILLVALTWQLIPGRRNLIVPD